MRRVAWVVLGGAARRRRGRSSSNRSSAPLAGRAGGLFEVTDDTCRAAELGLQYRGGLWRWRLHPMVGAMVTSAGATSLYAGFGLDVPLGNQVHLRGSFAPGFYDRGESGKHLGYPLEFRSSVELAWRLRGEWRVGVELYHLSNARLGESNPGNGSFLLVVTVPFGRGPPSERSP